MELVSFSYAGADINIGKTLAINLVTVPIAWVFLLVIRYIRINPFFKTSVLLAVTSTYTFFVNPIINYILEGVKFKLPLVYFAKWSNDDYINGNISAIILITSMIFALIFISGGIALSIKNQTNKKQIE